MKKLILLLAIILGLTGCQSTNDTTTEPESKEESVKIEPTQEELNAKLKAEAVKADFVEINVDNPVGKKVFAEGEVTILTKGALDEFTLTTKEGDGYGIYQITLANTTEEDYSEGDIVRIYGTADGKDELGMPKILATIVEKVE